MLPAFLLHLLSGVLSSPFRGEGGLCPLLSRVTDSTFQDSESTRRRPFIFSRFSRPPPFFKGRSLPFFSRPELGQSFTVLAETAQSVPVGASRPCPSELSPQAPSLAPPPFALLRHGSWSAVSTASPFFSNALPVRRVRWILSLMTAFQ